MTESKLSEEKASRQRDAFRTPKPTRSPQANGELLRTRRGRFCRVSNILALFSLFLGLMEQVEKPERLAGRYELADSIGVGGMAKVHLGRLVGPAGFTKPVAVKRLHEHLAEDPDFVEMFLDEARLAAKVRHPNVVPTLEVVQDKSEIFLVLEYVEGESLGKLLKAAFAKGQPVEPRIVSAIVLDALRGLQAAHEAKDDRGERLGIVHRDVSPQNILVGTDGIARVLDFGIAKGEGRIQATRDGRLKGKIRYMAPEQVEGEEIDARADVYSVAVTLWEALAQRPLIDGANDVANISQVLEGGFDPPSKFVPEAAAFDAVVMKGLAGNPDQRYSSAREMATDLAEVIPPAQSHYVADWVQGLAGEELERRAAKFRRMESVPPVSARESLTPPHPSSLTPPASFTPPAATSPISQPSSTSRRKSSALLPALIAFLTLALLGGVAFVFLGGEQLVRGDAAAAPETQVQPPAPKAAAAKPEADQPTAEASETAPPEGSGGDPSAVVVPPEEVLDLDALPSPAAAPKRRSPKPSRGAPKNKPTANEDDAVDPKKASEKPDCSNPFFVDSDGIKHVRQECM